jgi:GNAT superfamily N-acetyltransferase
MSFKIVQMPKEEFIKHYNLHKDTVFEDDHSYFFMDLLTQEEKAKKDAIIKERGEINSFRLYLAAFDEEDNFAGWSWGYEENAFEYYMCNSAVLPEYRRKGIYSALLEKNLEILTERGYQKIYSRHCATNNDVIIPKLKAGFNITTMQLDDIFGVLVHLSYFPNKIRKKILDYRCGQLKPDAQIKEIFKM